MSVQEAPCDMLWSSLPDSCPKKSVTCPKSLPCVTAASALQFIGSIYMGALTFASNSKGVLQKPLRMAGCCLASPILSNTHQYGA